jgi:hypothetical protein
MATIIPKKSTVAGKVPTSNDLGLGEICLNHADHLLYSRHPGTGAVYAIGGASAAVERFWAFALIGNAIYLGSISTSDFPSTGSVYDVATWDINRTTTNDNGDVVSESSATGAWNNKTNLTYA